MYILIFAAGFISAVILLFIMFFTSNWYRVRRRKKSVKIDTYVKAATTIVLIHGLVMVTMSYVLAWFEKDAVVDVSTTLITEIVAPLCLYMGTNCIMNIFEKNKLSFSVPLNTELISKKTTTQNSNTDNEAVG